MEASTSVPLHIRSLRDSESCYRSGAVRLTTDGADHLRGGLEQKVNQAKDLLTIEPLKSSAEAGMAVPLPIRSPRDSESCYRPDATRLVTDGTDHFREGLEEQKVNLAKNISTIEQSVSSMEASMAIPLRIHSLGHS